MTQTTSIIDLIGDTPLIRLRKASEATGCEILGKAEFLNPGQSIKDRAAWGIVRDARGAWDGRTACLQCFTAADVVETYGAFHDVDDFRRHIAEHEAGWGSGLLHELGAHLCNRRVQRLRRAGTRA